MGKILINEKQLEFVTEYVLLEQQSVGDVVQIDGKKYKITDLIKKNLPKTNVGQKFASGTYQLSDESKTGVDNLLKKMITFFKTPELQNTTFNIKLEGGASQVPLSDALADKLKINKSLDKFVGRNQELAKKRATAITQLLANGLKNAGITNVTVPTPVVTVGKTKWDKNKGAKHPDYSNEQFMNVSVEASGTKVVKEQLPEFCKQKFTTPKGNQGTKSNGYRIYPEGGYSIDMGEGVGNITLKFNAFSIPDMFEVVYDGETYRSKNPKTGEQGFVSGRFQELDEGQIENLKVERQNLTQRKEKYERAVELTGKLGMKVGRGFAKRISYWFPLSDRKVPNTEKKIKQGEQESYSLSANNEADLQWFQEFFKQFPDYKSFKNFSGNFDSPKQLRKAAGLDTGVLGISNDLKDFYELVEKKRESIKKQITNYKKRLTKETTQMAEINNKLEYSEKYGGNLNAYLKGKDAELKQKGFKEDIIGPNGEISFTKKGGVNTMTLQVYAPLGGTAWGAEVGCKPVTISA